MVAALVEILSQLRRLAAPRLADNDHDAIIPDDGEELIPDAVDWQELSLLLEGLAPRELADSHLLLGERIGVPVVGLVVNVFCRARCLLQA